MEAFVAQVAAQQRDVATLQRTGQICAATMAQLVTEGGVKAVLMGSRATDPHCGDLEECSPSSPGWPPFMRVNPLLHWDYADVWRLIDACRVPYCELYDRGYTSLGDTDDTLPHPDLAGRPARELVDGGTERCGRRKKKKE